MPWLRSIDAFHTHDAGFQLALAGGVTTVQVLPGSANAIGTLGDMLSIILFIELSAPQLDKPS